MNISSLSLLKEKHQLRFTAVVAMTPDRIIGKDGGMPWHLPDDLKVFRQLTTGHPIVMGRTTFNSIGKPLPHRQNIVLTHNKNWSTENVDIIHSWEELFSLNLQNKEVCIIGGSQIYTQILPLLDTLYVSQIHQDYEGDTFFPDFAHYFSHKELIQTYEGFDLLKYSK